MRSKITDKFQITIPKRVREKMKLSRHDMLEWSIEGGRIVVTPVKADSIRKFRGCVRVGRGDIDRDIEKALKIAIAGKYGKISR